MGPSLPLQDYAVIKTRDVDEARESIARYFWRHRLDLKGKSAGFDARLHHAPLDNVSLNFVGYGADLSVDAGQPPDCYMAKLVLSGRLTARRGSRRLEAGPGDAILTGPCQYLDLRFSPGTDLLVLKTPRALLDGEDEATPTSRAGAGRRFVDEAIATQGPLSSFRRALSFLRDELDAESSLLDSALARSDYEEFLVNLLSYAWPRARGWQDPAGSEPLAVRRAIDYLNARRFEEVRMDAVIAAAGIGSSALHHAFIKHTGSTPMRFLRGLRLSAARDCLQDPLDERSVTQIALDCGFGHLGRFSGQYREAFGELPGETRRRKLH